MQRSNQYSAVATDAAELIQHQVARAAFVAAMRRCVHRVGMDPGVAFHVHYVGDADQHRRDKLVTSALDHLRMGSPDSYAARLARPCAHAHEFDFFVMAEGVELLTNREADQRELRDWLQPWITGRPMRDEELRAPKSLATRVRESRERTLLAGGRRVPSGMLQPSAAAALEYLESQGLSAVGAISAALESLAIARGWKQ